MQILDLLYRIGDCIADRMEAVEDDITVAAWHGYWVSLATQGVTSPQEDHDKLAENMVAALRAAFVSLLSGSAGRDQ